MSVFRLDDMMTVEIVREISQDYDMKDLSDDPSSHRWRAWWKTGYSCTGVDGIILRAYPVVSATPKGVWIDVDAWREPTKQPWEDGAPCLQWNKGDWHKKRWVGNDSGQAWAKPTRDEAIISIAIRLDRWANKIAADARRARQAADVLAELRPDLCRWSDRAKLSLQSIGKADHD